MAKLSERQKDELIAALLSERTTLLMALRQALIHSQCTNCGACGPLRHRYLDPDAEPDGREG